MNVSHQDVAVQKHEAATKGLRHVYPLVLELADCFEQNSVRNLVLFFYVIVHVRNKTAENHGQP